MAHNTPTEAFVTGPLPSAPVREPLPAAIFPADQGSVVKIARGGVLAVMDIGDRVFGKQAQNCAHLLRAQRGTNTIDKNEPRRREKDVEENQELLLAQRKAGFPLLFGLESARVSDRLFEVQFPQQPENAIIGNLAFASARDQEVSQSAWRQIRPLRKKQNVVGAGRMMRPEPAVGRPAVALNSATPAA